MQTAPTVQSVKYPEGPLGAPLEEGSIKIAGETCDFPRATSNVSPFHQPPTSERRLNLSEVTNDLSVFPEEVRMFDSGRPRNIWSQCLELIQHCRLRIGRA